MDDVKRTYREGEDKAKEAWRKSDGHEDLADKAGNPGDDIRKDLGNAGDDLDDPTTPGRSTTRPRTRTSSWHTRHEAPDLGPGLRHWADRVAPPEYPA